MVLEFYNKRRKETVEAMPNAAHLALVKLKKKFDVQIITQNIDDLHERAGSKKIFLKYLPDRYKKDSIEYRLYDTTPEQEWQHLSWFDYSCYLVCKLPR